MMAVRGTGEPAEIEPCAVKGCKRAPAIGRVCRTCFAELHGEIWAIPSLFDRLSTIPATPPEGIHQKPVFESKSPANDYAIMLSDARSIGGPIWLMREWQVAFWRLKSGVTIESDREIGQLSLSMSLQWPKWAKTEFAGSFFADMHQIWLTLAQAVGESARPNAIGLCECGGRVFAPKTGEKVECFQCLRVFDSLTAQAIEKAQADQFFGLIPFWRELIRPDGDHPADFE